MLNGSDGNDYLSGGDSSDAIDSEPGNDELHRDDVVDELISGTQNDILYGTSNNDFPDGGPVDDRLYGDPSNDTLTGGQGDYHRCGLGVDRITNFNIADGDHESGDCEVKCLLNTNIHVVF